MNITINEDLVTKLVQLALDLAQQQGKPEDGGGQVCECFYTMGQVRHICFNCRARDLLKEAGV